MIRGSGSTIGWIRDGWIRWDEEDVVGLTAILGPENTTKSYVKYQDSILKAIEKSKTKFILDQRLQSALARAKAERVGCKKIKASTDADPPKIPRDVLQRLWAHQRVALSLMQLSGRPSFLLADQPGVGKTPPAIVWAAAQHGKRVLVVTTNSAKGQWRREIKRWTGERATIVDGTVKEQRWLLHHRDGWVITHWESLVHARRALLKRSWDVAILDEAQAIRNRKAQRTETAFEIDAAKRIAMTGHPFFNSPDELWPLLRFLYPDEYTSFWRFWGMHVKALPKAFGGFDVQGVRDPKLLRWEIAPFSLRRTKRQVFKSLPEITRTRRELVMGPAARKEYGRLTKQFFVSLQGHEGERILAIPSVLARVTRLRQYLVDPGLLGSKQPSIKYPLVRELIDELDGPPVIFTMFKQAALRLQQHLQQTGVKRVELISGGMKKGASAQVQERFLAGKLDALIVVTQAGGTALNLGKYGYVIHLDLPWTAADLEQCEGRVDRPEEGTGKIVPTTAFPLVVKDSYEQRQIAMLEKKRSMFDEVFTIGELRRLFAA